MGHKCINKKCEKKYWKYTKMLIAIVSWRWDLYHFVGWFTDCWIGN